MPPRIPLTTTNCSSTRIWGTVELAYLALGAGLQLCIGLGSVWLSEHGLPFLPLMTTSVYCSLGLHYAFVRLYLLIVYTE